MAKIVKKARDGNKGPVEAEKPTINFAYASVVSTKKIKKGDVLTKDNIWVRRPGTGEILARHYNAVLNKKALRDIDKNKQISWKDIE